MRLFAAAPLLLASCACACPQAPWTRPREEVVLCTPSLLGTRFRAGDMEGSVGPLVGSCGRVDVLIFTKGDRRGFRRLELLDAAGAVIPGSSADFEKSSLLVASVDDSQEVAAIRVFSCER